MFMKTRQPECYIPSAETVSRNIKAIFLLVQKQLFTMLKVSLNGMKCHIQLTLHTSNTVAS